MIFERRQKVLLWRNGLKDINMNKKNHISSDFINLTDSKRGWERKDGQNKINKIQPISPPYLLQVQWIPTSPQSVATTCTAGPKTLIYWMNSWYINITILHIQLNKLHYYSAYTAEQITLLFCMYSWTNYTTILHACLDQLHYNTLCTSRPITLQYYMHV